MKLQCGHSTSCELDTICPKCGRSYISMPFIPYLVAVGVILFIFYFGEKFHGGLQEKLNLFFISFFLFLIISILRKKTLELVGGLMVIVSSVIIAFEDGFSTIWGDSTIFWVLRSAYLLLSLPIAWVVWLGFRDARHHISLNNGSFWIVFTFLVSALVSGLYLILPGIIKLNPFQFFNPHLARFLEYLGIFVKLRTLIVVIVFGVILLISISGALIRELKVRKQKIFYSKKEEDESLTSVIFLGLSRFFNSLGEALFTGIDLGRQLLSIISFEIWKLIKNSFIRAALILVKLLKVATLAITVFLSCFFIKGLAGYVLLLWSSASFWGLGVLEWAMFCFFSIGFAFSVWLVAMVACQKWKVNSADFLIGIKDAFSAILGTKNSAFAAQKSITLSVFMYNFFLSLAFLGAWIFIVILHLIIPGLVELNPIGVLFCLTILLVTILGVSGVFLKNKEVSE